MDILQKILGELGLPVLRSVVDKVVPGGGMVIDVVADALGIEGKVTPERVAAEIQRDTGAAYQKLESVETDYARIAEAASAATVSYHQLISRDASSENWVVRNWRPLNALGFGLASFVVVMVTCVVILRAAFGRTVDLDNTTVLVGLVAPTLTVWAGVVGAYVFKRTEEKKSGVN